MQATERPEFTPPPQPGLVRGLLFALLAHGLLMAALTWGVRWNREDTALSVEAELWSATPQQAAPRPVEPPPAPTPPAPPAPKPAPAPPPPPPVARDAEIALEREKQRQLQEKQRQAEQERQRKLAEQKKQEALKKQEEQARAAKLRQEQEAKQREEQAAKLREELRREQIKRVQGLAGATGGPDSGGSALRSSGPSPSYAGRIAAAIKRNVVFNERVAGNPAAQVRIRVAPDGTIVGKTLAQGSGNKAWDDAVLRAVDRTATIPRDTDGRVVPEILVTFRPND